MITEDDVLQVQLWLQARRERVSELELTIEVTHPTYTRLVEDGECCDLLLEILDLFKASDMMVTGMSQEWD